MDEKELKTSTGQRVAITLIAIIMLGSVIAGYVAIVASGSRASGSSSSEISEEKKQEYTLDYTEKLGNFSELTAADFGKFSEQLGAVSTFDEESANTGGVKIKELVYGDGRELTEGDTDYLAYYVGWCADGTVFDSSLDDADKPTMFKRALDASQGLIEGWNTGVVGMRLGGIRRITIPGELAYGSSKEICGGYNKPLRFLVMAVANEDPLKTSASELNTASLRVQYANYGMDYDAVMSN